VGLLLAGFARPATGQEIRSVVAPRARVFPSVGPGVTALKRDSAGRYYILAKPANVISIYDGEGNRIGQIPNANSHGATIKYAVDIDLGSDGSLFVADRGANAIDIFTPDGSLAAKVTVIAPTSVVALSGNQFAVTSLTSAHLVQIVDERGKVVRSFGDPEYVEEDSSGKAADNSRVADWGRITGDSAGGVYFAFTSLAEPTLRKYDRFGYVAYETAIPESFFRDAPTGPRDRVEVGLNFTQFSLSERTDESISVGSSGDVKFGSGLGMGLNQLFASGGNFGRGGSPQSAWQSNFGGAPLNFGNNSSLGGSASGELSKQGAQFHFGVGEMSGMGAGGRRGRGAGGGGFADQTTDSNGGVLQFFGGGNSFATGTAQNASGGDLSFTQQDLTLDASSANDVFGTLDANGNPVPPGIGFQPTFGGQGAFAAWSIFNARDFRPRGGAGPGGPSAGGANATFAGPLAGGAAAGSERPAGAGSVGIEPRARFFPHGRFGAGETSITATARVNLGDLGPNSTSKLQITAVSADPSTQEMWAGIGDTLVGFSKDGTPIGVYYLTLEGGAPLTPSAVLVEPDRFLVAADPWGIFEFDRPDRSRLMNQAPAAPAQLSVQPGQVSPKQ
jgi:hypothetical protein